MYNATAPLFREQVFQNTKQQTLDLAVKHIRLVRSLVDEAIARGDRTEWQLEYTPEAFSQTEPEFAVAVCNAVQDVWFAGKVKANESKIIFNLPATVEVATPNNYADQVSLHSFFIPYLTSPEFNLTSSFQNQKDRILLSTHSRPTTRSSFSPHSQ